MMTWALLSVALATSDASSSPGDAVILLWQGTRMCAGVNVAPDVIVTAYHCVAGGRRVRVDTRDGRRATGKVTTVDKAADLALVKVDLPDLPWLPLQTEPPEPGAMVTAWGHPHGASIPALYYAGTLRWSVRFGRIGAVGPRALQLDVPVNRGNSGGPVVDSEGRMVGIVSRRLAGPALTFASRSTQVAALLEAPPRRPLGGRFGFYPVAYGLVRPFGSFSMGVRGEASLHGWGVLSYTGLFPISHRWNAAVRGRSEALRGEFRLGGRLTAGHGPSSLQLDVWASAFWLDIATVTGPIDSLAQVARIAPGAGGSFRFRGVGIEGGAMLADGVVVPWGGLSLAFPGPFIVF